MEIKEIAVGDFVVVCSDTMSEQGVKRDDIVYVAGDYYVQTDENEDPYKCRKLFVIAKVDKDGHIDSSGCMAVEGLMFIPVPEDLQLKLIDIRNKDYMGAPDDPNP